MSIEAAGDIPEITLGWRMRIARDRAGMDQEALARATGIARNTISNYELGVTSRPKSIYLRAMALAMGVNPTWLETGAVSNGDGPGGGALPHLDSNQKPFGMRFGLAPAA